MPYDSSGASSGDLQAAMAILGGVYLIFFIIYVIRIGINVWSYGTLLKGTLNQPKALALLLVIPIVNTVMAIVWGIQASKAIKEREATSGGGGETSQV